MIELAIGIFVILHGLVHLLYFGQSRRYFELQPGMKWPDHARFFKNLDSTQKIRRIAGVLCVLSAFIFAGGGLLVLFNNSWSDLILIPATVISTFLYLIMWNGKYKNLADQGAIGILINLIIIAWIVFL